MIKRGRIEEEEYRELIKHRNQKRREKMRKRKWKLIEARRYKELFK